MGSEFLLHTPMISLWIIYNVLYDFLVAGNQLADMIRRGVSRAPYPGGVSQVKTQVVLWGRRIFSRIPLAYGLIDR